MDRESLARRRPVIRIFVSSTFADLKHEREALQRDVFPELERFCAARQFQFQAIDLRWGIPTEASLDHRTMQICFKELQRSQEISPQPNFLILLGNRYGWRPLPEEISVDEYERLSVAASALSGQGTLDAWYPKDENADPPVHIFQSRKEKLHSIPGPQRDETWKRVEADLWKIVNSAFPPSSLDDRFERLVSPNEPLPSIVRFQTSATEQEIWRGALGAPNAREHVLACFREIDNITEIEEKNQRKEFVDVVEDSGEIDEGPQKALTQLKQELRSRLGQTSLFTPEQRAHLRRTTGENGRPIIDVLNPGLDEMCSWIVEKLRAIIVKQIDEYWGTTAADVPSPRELQLERREHELFGQDRAPEGAFVGREHQLRSIRDYIQSESNQILVVHGTSGCGKTALVARAAQIAADRKPVVRFLGITPRSTDVRSLLVMLCRDFRDRHAVANEIPNDLNELIRELHEHFQSATPQNPVVLFLDGLDQLSDVDNGRWLNWIPSGRLPNNVKVIVSCLSDRAMDDPAGQPYSVLRKRDIGLANFIDVDALSEHQARELLFDVWLAGAGRKLTQEQKSRIGERLVAESARQPLYLKILFEECRLWRSWDTPPAIGATLPDLLQALLARLGDTAIHGATLASSLAYLACARRGLTEVEILEVLYRDTDYQKFLADWTRKTGHHLPDNPPRIPGAIWSRLRFDLAPYFAEQGVPGGTVLTFYHRQLADYVREHFLDEDIKRLQWHERLAEYFHAQDYWRESLEDQRKRARTLPPTPRPANVRKVDELPWQRLQAAILGGKDDAKSAYWDKVADLLTDWQFLEAKTEAQP